MNDKTVSAWLEENPEDAMTIVTLFVELLTEKSVPVLLVYEKEVVL